MMDDLIFKGTVDEIDVGKLAVGMEARIKVGALPSDVVTGRVARIAPQAQQKEGATLFDVEIELDPGRDHVCAPATRPTPTSSSARRRTF
jgi:multidrug resistance efflux pump